ncbi:hypothetical protein GQR58_009461 [Nymphon striatum]|nr:hypothetical protein GQR58_009461 [Nymphon striatum]
MSFLSILVIDGSFSVKFVDMLSFDRDITAVYDRFGSFSKDTLMKLGDFNTIRVNGITDIGLDMENIKKIFQDSLHEIKSKEYDIFDPKVKQFNADYEHFMDKIKDIEVESSIDSILSCNVLKISKGTISVNFTDELCLLIRETGLMLKMGLKVPAIAAMIHRKESQLKKARDKLLDTCTKKADILEMKNQSIYNAIDEIFNLYNQYSGRKDYDLTDIKCNNRESSDRTDVSNTTCAIRQYGEYKWKLSSLQYSMDENNQRKRQMLRKEEGNEKFKSFARVLIMKLLDLSDV